MTLHERIRQLERGLTLAIRRMGVDPERPEQAPEVWKEARQAVAWGKEAAPEGRAYRDAMRLVNELDELEGVAGVRSVRVYPASESRALRLKALIEENLGLKVGVYYAPDGVNVVLWAKGLDGQEIHFDEAFGQTPEAALEALAREYGLLKEPERHDLADGRAASPLERLEGLGYEVRVSREIGPREGEAWHLALALYEGRVVAHAYGQTEEEALWGLVRELGVAL